MVGKSFGYSKRSLRDKLGMKEGVPAVVLQPPKNFHVDGISVFHTLKSSSAFILFFTKSKRELQENFPKLKSHLQFDGMLWIAWPKKSSHVPSDLDENEVMKIGLDHGLVDIKVAAIDEIWSGLKFVYRRKDRQ